MSTFSVFVNFRKDYNRYKAKIFSVNITFDNLFNGISHIIVPQNFIISTCLRYVVIMCVIFRNRVFRFRQKYPLTCRCIFSSPCSEKKCV